LLRWSEILDDWTLNWQRDVERSPLPVRDYNLLYVCRIQGTRDKLKTIAQMRPSFVDDLPAATLARWLMAMHEEYLSSAIRLGRSGLYNFRIMALNSMLPTALQMLSAPWKRPGRRCWWPAMAASRWIARASPAPRRPWPTSRSASNRAGWSSSSPSTARSSP
jgi:hypothetical protein